MKNLFKVLVFLMVATVSLYSAAPTDGTGDSKNYLEGVEAIDSDGAFDTLAAADSSTLYANFKPEPGREYILVRDAFTGTGSDSVSVQVVVDAKDSDGNLLRRAVVDSFTAAAGEDVLLPFGGTLFGQKYDIKLLGYGADGGQLIVNRLYLYKRTNYLWQKATKNK